ncbi:copper-binding protein [Massilia sp. IC2-476]|uniref:copper-binding protein n=1 Tax=Massilia sp. IC2-476 TaxID=2887199 RepID=UPI001D127452|nr:copper-binding protein [Massilia sp. IC2-476]MCC2973795.1 copper-binding protein [Massilia sp. IC2-476]
MNAIPTLMLAAVMAAATSMAVAQDSGHAHHEHAAQGAPAAAELADGEVRKIDKDAGKITLRHGELKNLNMSAMTMVFRVKDSAMLDAVKPGDKVRFAAERVDGAITIVQLQAAQ